MFRFALLFLVVCLAGPAANSDPWLQIKSTNFELFTTAGERSGRDLIKHFERVHSFFEQAFKMQGAARPAQVIAFRSEKEYAPYRPNAIATAFFQGGEAHDFIVMQSAASEHYSTAVHEYIHLLVRQSKLRVPVWFNEGLAELYSSLEPQGSKVLVGKVAAGRGHVLVNEKWIPLRTLLAVGHDSPLYNEKARAGMFYAESWALMHMLQMSPAYSGTLGKLIDALKDNAGSAALEKACGKSIDRVEMDLHDYVSSPTLNARLFNIQLPKSVDTPEITAEAALPARLAIAEMQLSGPDSRDKALAAFQQLATDFPERWEASAGIASFYLRKREFGEAAKHFARARELGSTDSKMYLQYGKTLIWDNRAADAVPVLAKAAELEPGSIEANVELGAALVRTSMYREAIEAFKSIKSVTPDWASRYFYNFAYACYRLGAVAEAKQLIAKGRPHITEANDLLAIDRLSQILDARTERAALPPRPSQVETDDARPRITRTPEELPPPLVKAPTPAPEPEFPVAEARLDLVECVGQLARLHVNIAGAPKIFVIADPSTVTIRSGNGAPVEFQCGKQTPRTVRISYEPVSGTPGVTGKVRALDFP